MTFEELINNLKKEIRGITDDSRVVKKGYLFVAVKGLKTDGHKYIPTAIDNGAKIIIGEENLKFDSATYIKVEDSRKALGLLASSWYGNPSSNLKVIGVTGTDGKTTTANLIYCILKYAGKKVGLVSTINARIGNKEYDTGFHVTNPEALLLQKLLSEMVKKGCEFAILEVTSHGLDQERVAGVKFDAAVLTNITHEHLDYHGTWKAYRDAKAKLFKDVSYAIINKDDKSFSFIKKKKEKAAKVFSYAIKSTANFKASQIKDSKLGTNFEVSSYGKIYDFDTQLLGDYNISNILAAISVGRVFKISWKDIQSAIYSFKPLIGRLEKIPNGKGIEIYVDFAHTPNALEKVLTLLKKRSAQGQLIVVFGCASERDDAKRPMMAEISTRIADSSIFTAEDPRSEDINNIIREMRLGVKNIKAYIYDIPERGEAIFFAINKLAKKSDIVVVCGKGHEKSMAYFGVEYPWSDQEAVEMALAGKVKRIARK